jgi:2-succinyl-5-enolpyruvyl-6-hydroxy-3-cyclohexene-1-carboxylate synthase
VDFGRLAAAHGISHEFIVTARDLAVAVERLPSRGLRILEIRTDRAASGEMRNRIWHND